MPQRLGYKKSRSGCTQCKRRRVKCDEAAPCSACVRHGQRCSLVGSRQSSSPRSDTPQTTESPLVSESNTPQSPTAALYSPEDMLLLHHFTTETAATFSRSPLVQNTWAKVVPRLAEGAEYVMRAVLAVAAIHKFSADPAANNRFHSVSIRHLNESLALSRPHMANIDDDNGIAIVALSTLVSIFSFTQPLYYSDDHMPSKPVDQLINAVHMFSGSRSIITQKWRPARDSELSPILHYKDQVDDKIIPPGVKVHLDWLHVEIDSLANEDVQKACKESADTLEAVFRLVTAAAPELEMGHVLRWTAVMTPEYMMLLQQRSPPALAILAMFSAVLLVSHGGWVFGPWRERLRRESEEASAGTHWAQQLVERLPLLDREFEALFPS